MFNAVGSIPGSITSIVSIVINMGRIMTNTDIKILLFAGVSGVACLISGLRGILNREKINKISDFYMCIDLLLLGIMSTILLLFFLFFRVTPIGLSMMSEKRFDMLVWVWFMIFFFVGGVYGILNKKKINNYMNFQLSIYGVGASIIAAIGVVAFLLQWGWPK